MNSFSNKSNFVYPGKSLEAMSFAKNYHAWIYEKISKQLGHKIAEVGSGTGNFTQFLASNKNTLIDAYEPCVKMHSENKQNANCRVSYINKTFDFDTVPLSKVYSSIIFINVLEHIEDDLLVLKVAHKSLARNGKLIIFVPALQLLYSNFDKSVGHFRRYNKKQLCRIVEKSKFTIDSCNYFDSFGILPWFLFMKILGGSLNSSSSLYYDRLIVPWLKKLESIILPPIGKNLLLIASKSVPDQECI
jgi:SAM-dependent methyltransferase